MQDLGFVEFILQRVLNVDSESGYMLIMDEKAVEQLKIDGMMQVEEDQNKGPKGKRVCNESLSSYQTYVRSYMGS